MTTDPARDVRRARNIARALGHDLNDARDLARARALDLNLGHGRGHGLDLTPDLNDALTIAHAIARNLDLDLDHARDLARHLDLGLTFALDLARGRDRALVGGLRRARERVALLAVELEGLQRAGAGDGVLSSAVPRLSVVSCRVTVWAVRLLPAGDRDTYAEMFRSELYDLARDGGGRWWLQLRHAVRVLVRAPWLRRELRAPAPAARERSW